jgi:hypothetical protein
VAGRLWMRHAPPRRAAKPAAPYVHPIVPSPPVVNPPPRNCRVPDLEMASAMVGNLRQQVALGKAKAEAEASMRRAAAAHHAARPPSLPAKNCRDQPEERALAAQIDMLGQGVSRCVAQDAPLDGAWNLVQSAVMALQICADCSKEPAAREKGCAQVPELLGQVKKNLR